MEGTLKGHQHITYMGTRQAHDPSSNHPAEVVKDYTTASRPNLELVSFSGDVDTGVYLESLGIDYTVNTRTYWHEVVAPYRREPTVKYTYTIARDDYHKLMNLEGK